MPNLKRYYGIFASKFWLYFTYKYCNVYIWVNFILSLKVEISLGQNHPSLNTYLSSNTFQYFPNFLTKLNNCCVIGCTNQRASNFLQVSKVKEHGRKHKFLSMFLKKQFLTLFLVPTPYLPHFQSVLNDVKLDGWMRFFLSQKQISMQQ